MKNALIVVLSISFLWTARAENAVVKHVNPQTFSTLISDSSGTLLDVRTLGEFKNGHLDKAGQLNYYTLDFKQKLLLLPKDQPIYLYCNTGYRSEKAAAYLVKNGYTEVYNLENGIMAWNIENLPVIIAPDARADTKNRMGVDEYKALINSDKLVFVDFYAPWCAPCRKMMPMVDSLSQSYQGDVNVVKINVDASKKLMKELGLVNVPYLVLYHNGDLLFSHNGLISRQEIEIVFDKCLF